MFVPTTGARLGATPDADGTTFAVVSGGEAVELCLFDEAGHESRIPVVERTQHVWHAHAPGVRAGDRYGFRVHGPWEPSRGRRFNHAKLLTDPYARAIDGELRLDDAIFDHTRADDRCIDTRDSAPFVPRSVVVEGGFDWRDDQRPSVPWSQTVVYELHVRGYTMRHPDVPERLRGTYAGLAHPAVIEHLTALGVTTLELLPVHHHVPEPALLRRGLTNYWGYNTLGFFAPHAAYASAGSRGQQVHEFTSMVRSLHEAGLEVVLDVVFNHTAEGGPDGPTLSLRGLDNAAYYRLRDGHTYDDFTGCGNTVDLRHPQTLRLVIDSLRHWVQEMHVDGFRFDLAPALARSSDAFDEFGPFLTAIAEDPVLAGVKLIAEPWDLGPDGYQLGHFPSPWSEWNDRFRDTVRQSWLGDRARKHGSGLRDLSTRQSGSPDVFPGAGRGPLASVNFVTAHDGFTLHDLVTYERKRNEPNGEDNRDGADHNLGWNCGAEGPTTSAEVRSLRRRMMRNLTATLLTSTGVPMLTAGDETGRTQLGNNNAYCLDDESTWVDWSWVAELHDNAAGWRLDLLSWTRALIALRRSHRVLRHDAFPDDPPVPGAGRRELAWFTPDGQQVDDTSWSDHELLADGAYFRDQSPDGTSLLLLLNTGPQEIVFTLPGPSWAAAYRCLLDTAAEQPAESQVEQIPGSTTPLSPYSCRVLLARR